MQTKFITGASNSTGHKLVVMGYSELSDSDYPNTDSETMMDFAHHIPAVTLHNFFVKFIEKYPVIFSLKDKERIIKALDR